jgi:hypothetical protein
MTDPIRDFIRKSSTSDLRSGAEINAYLRGISVDEILKSRKPEERKLTQEQFLEALDYEASHGCTFKEAVDKVKEARDGTPSLHERMNSILRGQAARPAVDSGNSKTSQSQKLENRKSDNTFVINGKVVDLSEYSSDEEKE